MSRRFYMPNLVDGPAFRLTGTEAHHAARVLRCQPGDEVTLFDGRGLQIQARVEAVTSEQVELARIGLCSDEPVAEVILATACPKGDRLAWLVEKATELGVHRLVPLITARSIVDPGAGKIEKLRRTIVEASKQCGRGRLMELSEPLSWKQFVETELDHGTSFIADPSGEPWTAFQATARGPLIFLIGPEGGFTPDEVEQACACGAKRLSLGPSILRIETAALAVATLARLVV